MLNEPLLALRGDHFIVRDETAQRTLGGGLVINPWAQRHKRGDRDLPAGSKRCTSGDSATLTRNIYRQRRIFRRCRSTRFISFSTSKKKPCAKP